MKINDSFNEKTKDNITPFIIGLTYKIASNQATVIVSIFAVALLIHTQGFCATTDAEMDTLATGLIAKLFKSWIKTILSTLTGFWAGFLSFKAMSFNPVIIWGGLFLIFNLIPSIVGWY